MCSLEKMRYWITLSFLLNLLFVIEAVSSNRIIGGEPALPGHFPYQVSIRKNNNHVCGGAIINPYFILTAATCVTIVTNNNKYEM